MSQTIDVRLVVFCALTLASILFACSGGTAHAANTYSVSLEPSLHEYLFVPDSTSTSPTASSTFEAWVKFDTLPATNKTFTIMSKWGTLSGPGNDANNTFALWFQNNSGTYQLQVGTDNGSSHQGGYINWSPSTNTWYHVAVVYKTNGTADLYINGASQGTATGLTTSLNDSSVPLLIGQYGEQIANDPTGTDGYFDGLIDDVRIYNIARTQTQIQSDYQQELNGTESGLRAYWTLNNNYNDLSGNGNTLQLSSFAGSVPF